MGISIHQAVCMVNGCTDGGGRLVDPTGTRVVAKSVHHLPRALGCSVYGGEGAG